MSDFTYYHAGNIEALLYLRNDMQICITVLSALFRKAVASKYRSNIRNCLYLENIGSLRPEISVHNNSKFTSYLSRNTGCLLYK